MQHYYSKKLLEHALNPLHVGEIENPDGKCLVGDPQCGDFLKVTLRIENERIKDIAFKCKGCPAAIGTASAMCQLAIGKTLDEADEITSEVITDYVDGLPEEKQHCSNLGAGALAGAIMNYICKTIKQEEMIEQGLDVFKT
ncbi:MAG: iron-sulfur cluster assembly scaffold protein [Pseudomonadota bacterium]